MTETSEWEVVHEECEVEASDWVDDGDAWDGSSP